MRVGLLLAPAESNHVSAGGAAFGGTGGYSRGDSHQGTVRSVLAHMLQEEINDDRVWLEIVEVQARLRNKLDASFA